MNAPTRCTALVFLLAVFIAQTASGQERDPTTRPNIVIVLADDK